MKYLINDMIPWLVLLAQATLILGLILIKYSKEWVGKHRMKIVFATALAATLGSLFYSLVMGYTPCDLCWYQRILMYPLVIIAGFSLTGYDSKIRNIILSMSHLGLLIAGYQYLTQITDTTTFCGIGASDCSSKIVFTFGYLSIPLMAFTAFAIIIVSLLIGNKNKKKT